MAETKVFIGNLPFSVTSQDLKDMFQECGQITFAEVAGKGKSKGFGTIQFSKTQEALKAIEEFNGADLDGRTIEVRWDKGPSTKQRKVVSTKKTETAPVDSNCLFVGNLSWNTTSEELVELFSKVAKVVDGHVVVAANGKSRGYGIVTLSNVNDAKLCQEKFNGYVLNDRQMEVKPDKKVAEKAATAKEQKLLINNLPSGTRWQPLKDYFRPYGTITRADVSKSSDGETVTGFITFADQSEAENAIASLNGTMFDGNQIEVVVDDGTTVVNSAGGVRVYVGNLPFQVRWQDLKDLFKDNYNPLRADVMMDGYRSKGFGIVTFATLEEAERAVEEFKDSLLMDRPLVVRLDKFART